MVWLKENKLIVTSFLSFLLLIPLITYIIKPSIENKKLTVDKNIPLISQKPSQEELFYADLEYNPKTSNTTQIATGKIEGKPVISPSQPLATTSGQFIYKVDVHSKDDKLLEQYWQAVPEKIVKTKDNTFKFRITTKYQPDSIVKLTLIDNKLIWTGLIK